MNEAIKLAIEKGGFDIKFEGQFNKKVIHGIKEHRNGLYIPTHCIFDRPDFWQALGKALGWAMFDELNQKHEKKDTWLLIAHNYFDLVLTSGDTKSFWKELLRPSLLSRLG